MGKRISLLALVLVMAVLAGCAQQETYVVPELQEPVGVQSDMATAYVGEIYDITFYDAAVVPYVEELWFEVDGSVSEMNVYAGSLVEEGEVMIGLDQTSEEERAEQLRSDIEYADQDNAYSDALAELDIELMQVELKQLQAQHADEAQIALKKNEIEQAEAALRQAQALREPDLEAKREELAEVLESLDKNVLRAPFDGRVIYGKQLTKGSWVTAYDPVIYVADDGRLFLRGEYVSEGTLKAASRVYARIGSVDYEIAPLPVDQEEYITTVLSGGTLQTEYEILGPAEELDKLEAGQYAAICTMMNYVQDALLVPTGAVLKDASGRYVYVQEDGERVRRTVKVGVSTDGLTQILEGLEEGEVVYVKD